MEENKLYDFDTPLIFSDGIALYDKLKKEYVLHKKGYFIYGPSGIGKSYFVEHQQIKNWVDGDLLWEVTNAFPNGDWWNWSGKTIDVIEQRADVITHIAREMGFWIIGASCVHAIPDAVVMPDFEKHLEYIKLREKTCYGGGLTSENIDKIRKNREYFLRFSQKGVPTFKSIEEAVNYLENKK